MNAGKSKKGDIIVILHIDKTVDIYINSEDTHNLCVANDVAYAFVDNELRINLPHGWYCED